MSQAAAAVAEIEKDPSVAVNSMVYRFLVVRPVLSLVFSPAAALLHKPQKNRRFQQIHPIDCNGFRPWLNTIKYVDLIGNVNLFAIVMKY